MDKKRVLVVHNYYQIPGGEDTVVANEIQMLKEHGHEVILYSRDNTELNELSKIRKLLLPLTMVFNFRTYSDIKSIIRENGIDIVHVHNTLNLISPAVYYAALHCKVPVVQTIHNFRLICPGAMLYREGHVCEECINRGIGHAVKYGCYRNSKIQTLACVLTSWIHRMTGIYKKIYYICLTEFNKEKLLTHKQIQRKKVFIKPNFININKEQKEERIRQNQYVFVGRLDGFKGIDVLLMAWRLMGKQAPKLLVYGSGPMEEWCRAYIEENELCSVELKGFVENSQVREVISESKAVVLPTRVYEGFPMIIAESYSCGTAVIGSDLGNTGDLIQEDITGYKFQANSPESLKKAIEKCENRPLYVLGEECKKYTAAANYDLLVQIYDQVLK